MSTSPRIAIVAAFVIVVSAAVTAASAGQAPGLPDPSRLPSRPGLPGAGPGAGGPPRDPSARRTPAAGTAAVRGRVVALDTGLPLRRARVVLYSSGEPHVAITDADGTFAFDRLPAGRYDLRASKARYVDTSHGVRRPGGPGRPLEVVDGQTVDDAVLALPPAGVITGRVVDDAGEVVTGAMVAPMRYRTLDGERQLTPFGQTRMTDDTGTFRLYGLAPGKYYLSARGDESQRFGGTLVDPNATGFAPTFFPGTAMASEAQPIEVVAGAEVLADVQLVTARLTTITGIVVDAGGSPATGGHVMVMGGSGGGRFLSGGAGGGIKPDGTFTITGLAPAEYTIVAQASFGEPSMFGSFDSRDRQKGASTQIVAAGAPITGLRIVVQDPVRIPVNVTFEDGAAAKPDRVFISANRERGTGGGQASMRDGRLSLEVVPGTYRLHAGSMSSQPWFVKRISYRGREVEDDEVELTAEPGGRIDVVFTGRASTVTGGVTDDSGKPVAEYMVIVVPAETEPPRRFSWQRLRVLRPEAQGRFRAEHMSPGRYQAVALEDAPIEDIQDVDFLDSVRRHGKPFTLAEGGSATLALTLTRLP